MERDIKESISKEELSAIIENKLRNVYFDVQGISVAKITEHHVARLITKVAVGAVTIWWSLIELRSIYNDKKLSKG